MDFGAPSDGGKLFFESIPMNSSQSNSTPNRVIGIDITFSCPGTKTIRRSFLCSDWKAVHLGREPADVLGVANAFMRTDVVPPVMSRKHAEIMINSETPQVVDTGSYHGTYFRASGQRLMANKPYLLTDGSVLEFGKSVTKDDKAHEPLLATINFIHESDRDLDRRFLGANSLLTPPSPTRRYSVPSDSDDEDDEDDESEREDDDDSSSRSDVIEYTPQPAHIDLTNMSDDGRSSVGEDEGIECTGFGFCPSGYDEGSPSGSDMSESEFEDDVGKVVTQPNPATNQAGPSTSTHGMVTPLVDIIAPAPLQPMQLPRLPRLEAALSGLQEYHDLGVFPLDLPNFAHRAMPLDENPRTFGTNVDWYMATNMPAPAAPQIHREPEIEARPIPQPIPQPARIPVVNEEMLVLKAELEAAHNMVAELKRSLAEKEKEKRDQDGDVAIAEASTATEPIDAVAADDLPTLVANIERMMGELLSVEDGELKKHLKPVLHLLAVLPDENKKLWHRVGDATMSGLVGAKRKRDDQDEETEVESRRAQSPMPESPSTPVDISTPAPEPAAAPSPSKRMRFAPVVSAVAGSAVGGAAMWSALAFGFL